MPEHDVVILCSNFDELTHVVCDLPLRHKGPHEAKLIWGDEPPEDDDGSR